MAKKFKNRKRKTIWQIFWPILLNTILVIFVLIGLLIIISLIPFKNNYKVLAVMSGSMEPTISTGSLLITKPVSNYKVGDIITFQSGTKKGDNTTHRIFEIEGQDVLKSFTTKGDANKTSDSVKISADKIIGKEVISIALIGYIIGYVKTLPGLILLIVIPGTIIVYEEINKIKAEAKGLINKRKAIEKKKARKNDKKA